MSPIRCPGKDLAIAVPDLVTSLADLDHLEGWLENQSFGCVIFTAIRSGFDDSPVRRHLEMSS